MQFGINYSLAAAELLERGAIALDFFKTPDWSDMIATASMHRPVRVHYAINVGADDSKTTDWAEADRLAKQTGTRYINCHLAPRAKDFHSDDPRPVVERMVADIRRLTDYFGADRVIAENIPLGNPDENFHPACGSADVIKEVLETTGVGFLFDMSHARLTARHLGLDERQYISSLPTNRIREMHLTGIQRVDGRWRDHMHFSEDDWSQTQWAFDCIAAGEWSAPELIALEYGGVGEKFAWRTRSEEIAQTVPRLVEMVQVATIERAFKVSLAEVERLGSIEALPEPMRVLLCVYSAQGVIDNGGFQYFFENDWGGQPSYPMFADTYRAIGAADLATALEKAAALFPFDEPHKHQSRRREFLAQFKDGGGHRPDSPFEPHSHQFWDRSKDVFRMARQYALDHRTVFGM